MKVSCSRYIQKFLEDHIVEFKGFHTQGGAEMGRASLAAEAELWSRPSLDAQMDTAVRKEVGPPEQIGRAHV